MNQELKQLLNESLYVHKEIKANEADSAETRWLNKKVYDSLCLYDGTSLNNVTTNACLEVSINHEVYLTGSSSKYRILEISKVPP